MPSEEADFQEVLPEDLEVNPFEDDPLSGKRLKAPATFFSSLKAKSMWFLRKQQNVSQKQVQQSAFLKTTRRQKAAPSTTIVQASSKGKASSENLRRSIKKNATMPTQTKRIQIDLSKAEQQILTQNQKREEQVATLRFVRSSKD